MKKLAVALFLLICLGGAVLIVSSPRNRPKAIGLPRGTSLLFSRGGIAFMRPAQHFPSGGFPAIKTNIEKLARTKADLHSVLISTPTASFHVRFEDAKIVACFEEQLNEAERRRALEQIRLALNAGASMDFTNGKIHSLQFPLSSEATEAAKLAEKILREVYGVTETSALTIRYINLP